MCFASSICHTLLYWARASTFPICSNKRDLGCSSLWASFVLYEQQSHTIIRIICVDHDWTQKFYLWICTLRKWLTTELWVWTNVVVHKLNAWFMWYLVCFWSEGEGEKNQKQGLQSPRMCTDKPLHFYHIIHSPCFSLPKDIWLQCILHLDNTKHSNKFPRFSEIYITRASLLGDPRLNIADPMNHLCLLPDCQISGNNFTYLSVQVFGGSDAPGSDPLYKIMRYWFYYSTWLSCWFPPNKHVEAKVFWTR